MNNSIFEHQRKKSKKFTSPTEEIRIVPKKVLTLVHFRRNHQFASNAQSLVVSYYSAVRSPLNICVVCKFLNF